nr:hypothetical protein [Nanoarchaeum sp.]
METIYEYRQVIENKTREVFINCLKEAIKKLDLKNIGYIGVIGSKKIVSHDIDVIIFPNNQAKMGATIIEISNLYKEVESILKKHHERFYLSVCPKKAMQEIVYYLSALEEGGAGMVPIHSLFYPDYKSFKKYSPKNFEKHIKDKMINIYGKFTKIRPDKELTFHQQEPYFFVIDFEMNARTKTFPRHLIRASAESLFEYLKEKYNIPIKDKKLHTISEIEKEFENILNRLDAINYR